MKRIYCLFGVLTIILTFPVITNAQKEPNTISGRVTNFGKPLANVAVLQIGGIYGTDTDANGRYEIKAYPRDTLRFSLVGMKTVKILLEDVTRTLNIKMNPRVNELDEITVTKRRSRTNKSLKMEYHTNKNIVKSAIGFLDKRFTSGNIQFIDGDDLLPVGVDFLSSLQMQGNFFGRIDRDNIVYPKVYVRRAYASLTPKREPSAIFDVDGQILTEAPLFLTVDNIDRIAILSGPNATAAYGMRGVGGVIVINTKGANIAPVSRSASGRPYADDSNIVNSVSVRNSPSGSLPNYMRDLNKASSESEAIAIFEKYEDRYGTSPYFLLDASHYFWKEWSLKSKADGLLEQVVQDFGENPVLLKAAAYLFEEHGNIEKAEDIYSNILELRPGYAQSYRDLAGIRTIAGEKRKALGPYGRYIRKSRIDTLEVPLTGIDSIVSTEVNNLVFLDSVKATRRTDNKTLQTVYWPARILVEWNNSEAEFDLQFVNPEDRFFIWSHTEEDNAERISEEKIKGYSSEQFLIDKSIAGEWKVNLKYFGNKSYDPTYFKISVYNEYGMPTQSRQIKVFKASEKNVNRYLSSIAVN